VIIGGATLIAIATRLDVHQAAEFDVVSVNGRGVEIHAHGAGPTGGRIQYHVDWDGHGCPSWLRIGHDTANCQFGPTQQTTGFKHTYDSPGEHKIVLEAIDPRWGSTSVEVRRVTV